MVRVPSLCNRSDLENALQKANFVDLDDLLSRPDYYVFSLQPNYWKEPPPLHADESAFWSRISKSGNLPDCFYIFSTCVTHKDSDKDSFLCAVKLVFKIQDVLKEISDLYVPSENKSLFLVSSEEAASKYTISLSIDYTALKAIQSPRAKLEDMTSVCSTVFADDVHQGERKEVMRRAIKSLLDEPHDNLTSLQWLLKNTNRINSKFKESYEIYFHNFSVSKLLNEIDQKNLEFSSKLMDFISNSNNKALAIPGAIAAIAVFLRISSVPGLILIVSGVYIATNIVIMSNKSMRTTFSDLEWQINKSFSKYKNIKDSPEVVSLADEVRIKLISRVCKASRNLKTVDLYARLTFWGGLIYSVIAALARISHSTSASTAPRPPCY
ncbi:hypothetical protein, partial [Halomonas colorata]